MSLTFERHSSGSGKSHVTSRNETISIILGVINFSLSLGSVCGSVGRVVYSNKRGPPFESGHRQLFLNQYFLSTVCKKDENREKEAGNGPF